jgi:transcriptional regulator with XRE-family HTH domain
MRTNQKIGEWIKQQRLSRDMLQRELAGKLGIFQPDVSFYEHGRHIPDPGMCKKLAQLFAADIHFVMQLRSNSELER